MRWCIVTLVQTCALPIWMDDAIAFMVELAGQLTLQGAGAQQPADRFRQRLAGNAVEPLPKGKQAVETDQRELLGFDGGFGSQPAAHQRRQAATRELVRQGKRGAVPEGNRG